jgi:hypothetical protein
MGKYNIGGIKKESGTTASIAAGGAATATVAVTGIGASETLSLQMKCTGTSPNVKVQFKGSLDATNYALPENGMQGEISAAVTDQNYHLFSFEVPLCSEGQLVFTNLSATDAVVVDYVFAHQ